MLVDGSVIVAVKVSVIAYLTLWWVMKKLIPAPRVLA
jgi:hypothetical protein